MPSKTYFMYFSLKKTWDDFKGRIVKLLKENHELHHLGRRSKPDIVLWTLQVEDLDSLRDKPETIPGYCLEQMIQKRIEPVIQRAGEDEPVILIELKTEAAPLRSSFGQESNPEILDQC